ncbi:TetR/AcrR family transcriptional regulator [Clostridiaceae bacterium M8S5]|nr:TetR/AcrR family transcriptional regulator [Clostridiaceae bacterium M8S5]
MARSFSEHEKENIRIRLREECTKSWAKHGYKKTSVNELCAKSGISKGAFYLFYDSKESLFCETLCLVQDNLYILANEIMEKTPNKYGFAKVLKIVYREYCKNSFICDTRSVDFIAFINKLSKEQEAAIAKYSQKAGQIFLADKPYLKFAINKEKAISVITGLLALVSSKDAMCYDQFEVFDFMVENLIDKIFE